jgi:hypothetical protein
MTASAMVEARATATVADITPPFCMGRPGNSVEPSVVTEDAAARRVVTSYKGQQVDVPVDDRASMLLPDRTLCIQDISGAPIGNQDDDIQSGDIVYGAVASGTRLGE